MLRLPQLGFESVRKCSGLDTDVTDNCLHSVGFDEAMFSRALRGSSSLLIPVECEEKRRLELLVQGHYGPLEQHLNLQRLRVSGVSHFQY